MLAVALTGGALTAPCLTLSGLPARYGDRKSSTTSHRITRTKSRTCVVARQDNCESPSASSSGSLERSLLAGAGVMLAGLIGINSPAWAKVDNSVLVGVYADPNHPGCQRTVTKDWKILGKDPASFKKGAGCVDGQPQTPWQIQGKLVEGDAPAIFIDFSQKDDTGESFVGTWSGKGIRFPDGNEWPKLRSQSIFVGDYNDPSHPGCVRRIGADGTVYGEDSVPIAPGSVCKPGTKTTPWTLRGVIGPDDKTILIDFDPIDEVKQGPVTGTWTGKGLQLPNGLWTKK
eukprot:jgi/Mesvir1/14908/Mv05506-RA.1